MKNTAQKVRTVFLALWRGILAVHRALCEFCLIPVKLYRKYISGFKVAPSCRFTPTCSEYAILAVREWGIVVGTLMALCRIIRCNPFSKGGSDPVPLRSAVFGRRNFPGGKK